MNFYVTINLENNIYNNVIYSNNTEWRNEWLLWYENEGESKSNDLEQKREIGLDLEKIIFFGNRGELPKYV